MILVPLAFTLPSRTDQYYVSTAGNDSNPGTFDQPFLTIAKAIALLDGV
jgi:hypothetical protein